MSKRSSQSEITVSRVIVVMLLFFLLSVLAALYVVPFKKHYLKINDYYRIIEYVSIAVTFLSAVACSAYAIIGKKKGLLTDNKIVTPPTMLLLSISAFLGALIIPLSNNRTVTYKFVILSFAILFVAYAVYQLVNAELSFVSIINGIYIVLLLLINTFYPGSATFNDKLVIGHKFALILFIVFCLFSTLVVYIISKKYFKSSFYHVCVLSSISIIAAICRFFVFEYVLYIAVAILVITYIIFLILEFRKK